MKKKVSIIVPIYNVECYLEECLLSIVKQTLQEIEILLVDDGSSDRSPEIIAYFADKDQRIKQFSQTNKGVSAARNQGIEMATGEYLLFVDSDDTITPDTAEVLYNTAIKTNSDLVLGNALFCYPDGSQEVVFKRDGFPSEFTFVSGESCYIALMERINAFPPSVCLFFIKRELVIQKKLFLKEGITHEDELWCAQAMLSAGRVSLLDFNYYYYRQHDSSQMHANRIDYRISSIVTVIKELNLLAIQFKKEDKREVMCSIYVKIFQLFYVIIKLQCTDNPKFDDYDYFSVLLEQVYPDLDYWQQRECLRNYLFSNPAVFIKLPVYCK